MHSTTLTSLKSGVLSRESFYKHSKLVIFCLNESFHLTNFSDKQQRSNFIATLSAIAKLAGSAKSSADHFIQTVEKVEIRLG